MKKLQLKKADFEVCLEKEDSCLKQKPAVRAELAADAGGEAKAKKPVHQGHFVTSPMVGTYYSAPAPDKPAFVKIGDFVEPETVVCVIEAMKVMNEVKAGHRGVVQEILTEKTQPVEFGTKLFRIE